MVKFIYSEKATQFCEIFPSLLTTVHTVKSKGKISENFVAFSEYMNFSLKPGKHRCNQACDFSTDTRERLDTHLCIEHMVFRTKCEQCDYSSEYPSVLKSHVQSVHEKIRHNCNLCERTYATKDGVRRHVKNVHGPTQTETSEADNNSSTDENDRDSVDTEDDENSTDEDTDTIGEALEMSFDKEHQMETSTPAPNAGDIETSIWIHDDQAWDSED